MFELIYLYLVHSYIYKDSAKSMYNNCIIIIIVLQMFLFKSGGNVRFTTVPLTFLSDE